MELKHRSGTRVKEINLTDFTCLPIRARRAQGFIFPPPRRGDMTEATEAKPPPPAEPRRFDTHHRGTFHGAEIAYRCVAGETHLPDAKGDPHASIFSFAYLADSENPARPVTFAFNGGPGSASLWLHMGALGPRRVVLNDPSANSGAPYGLVDNDYSII